MRNLAVKLGIIACSDCARLQNTRSLHHGLNYNKLKLLNRSVLTSFNSVVTSVAMGKTDFSAVLNVVEVEKRFPFDAETEDKLIAAGANVLSHKSIKDTYLDTSDYCLTSADHWLRRRNGKWQLKYPSPIQMSENSAAEYVECEDEDAILEIITKRLVSKRQIDGYTS